MFTDRTPANGRKGDGPSAIVRRPSGGPASEAARELN